MERNGATIVLQASDMFALYSLPNDDNYFLIRQQSSAITPFDGVTFDQPGFVFHPFTVSEKYPSVLIKKDKFDKNPRIRFKSENKGKVKVINQTTYLNTVDRFIEATQNCFKKLIFSRIETVNLPTDDLFPLFIALQATYPDTFVYLVNIPSIGCWMGASPEIFVKQQQNTIETVALAGTQSDLGIDLEKVVWGDKEIQEQGMVERYVKRLLKQKNVAYHKTGPNTIRAGKVLHLKTHFQFDTSIFQYDFLTALHPTPAVCGLPKHQAKNYIAQNEPHKRAYYCGFLGPINIQQSTDLYVNLRCMQVFKNAFALYIGGGITADSVATKEWEETEMKAQTLADVIESVYLEEMIDVSF